MIFTIAQVLREFVVESNEIIFVSYVRAMLDLFEYINRPNQYLGKLLQWHMLCDLESVLELNLMNRTYFHIGRSSVHLPPISHQLRTQEISSKNSLEEVSEVGCSFPITKLPYLPSIKESKNTLGSGSLCYWWRARMHFVKSKSWENFRSFFKPCWNFGPFSWHFGLCNGNFYMNRYNTRHVLQI